MNILNTFENTGVARNFDLGGEGGLFCWHFSVI